MSSIPRHITVFSDPERFFFANLYVILGCYGVFGITDYFEAFEKEAQQGYNIVDAAKAAKVKHLVFL
jgi:hypothetical protein